MNGKLGAIYIGNKQVGGFLDWRVVMNLSDGVKNSDRTHKLQSWRLTGWAHWISRRIEVGAEVRVRLCSDSGEAYWEGKGRLTSRLTDTLETLVHIQIEIVGSGKLEGSKI